MHVQKIIKRWRKKKKGNCRFWAQWETSWFQPVENQWGLGRPLVCFQGNWTLSPPPPPFSPQLCCVFLLLSLFPVYIVSHSSFLSSHLPLCPFLSLSITIRLSFLSVCLPTSPSRSLFFSLCIPLHYSLPLPPFPVILHLSVFSLSVFFLSCSFSLLFSITLHLSLLFPSLSLSSCSMFLLGCV